MSEPTEVSEPDRVTTLFTAVDINSTYLTIERRPKDIRFRVESRDGREMIFYATESWLQQMVDAARVRPAPSVEVRRCKICELLESAPEHAATMCVCSKGSGGCHCWFVRVGPIPTVAQPAPSTTDAERVRELVDEWDKNNAITLLGDHRDDLNDRILSLISEVRNESLQVTASGEARAFASDPVESSVQHPAKTNLIKELEGTEIK